MGWQDSPAVGDAPYKTNFSGTPAQVADAKQIAASDYAKVSGGWQSSPVIGEAPQSASTAMLPERKLGAYGPMPTKPPPPVGGLGSMITEPLASMATGMAAAPASWIAGLGAIPLHATGAIQTNPQDVQRNVQQAMTYQPETKVGQAATSAIAWPFEQLHKGAEWVGNKAFGAEGAASDTLAGAGRNATTETLMQLLQFLPMLRKGGPSVPPIPAAKEVEAARLGAGREQQMRDLPVPITDSTVGQVMRDPVQLRRERQIAQTETGEPIRDVQIQQNQQLLENLDTLLGRTGKRAGSEVEVGRSVAGPREAGKPGAEGALTRQTVEAKKEISSLYGKAEKEGELQGKVETQPLLNYLAKHEDPTQVSYAINKLKALKLIREDEFGNIVPMNPSGPMSGVLSLNELEGIRRAATAAQKDGGTKGHYAAELKGVIDQVTEGAGGDAYKAARASRKAYADRFEEPRAIEQLLDRTSRTDRATALEDVWEKTVLQGSIADVERVRDTLLNVTDRKTRDAGRKAWRDIAGQTVEHIKSEATKSAALDEAGRPNLSAPQLKRVLDGIGDDKLRLLVGDTATKQLRSLAEVAADLKTTPPARISGSDTGINLMIKFNRILDHIPFLGTIGRGIARVGSKMYQEGVAGREAKQALERPGSRPSPPPPIPQSIKGLAIDAIQGAPTGPAPDDRRR